MCKKILGCFLVFTYALFAQPKDSTEFKRIELKNVLTAHYPNDIQKQQAVAFLMDNISIQKSQNYAWVDESGKKVLFNEFDYDNKEIAVKKFKKLKDSIKIKPQTYKVMDVNVVTPELIIKDIDLAFDSWRNNPWSKSYDFAAFCEYILPYRSMTEPLEDWRSDYQFLVSNASNTVENKKSSVEVATNVILELKNFRFLESRPDPIPFLSPKQLLFRREGACSDLANLTLLACRSMGLAVTFDFTPFYGASSKRHFWNTIITEKGEHIPFNGNCFGNSKGLPYAYNATEKRLAKVFRKTYSIQQTALASIVDAKTIPDGFMKDKNIVDVTAEYVAVGKISYPIPAANPAAIGYLNVFNLGKWSATDWGKRILNTIEFNNLGISIVYLPSFYLAENQTMQYEQYPILLDAEKNQIVLKPNYAKTFSFSITKDKANKEKTLDFNSFEVFENEIFRLMVWDNGWKKIEEAISKDSAIHFSKIPDNGLFAVLCKKSNGYERIFRINTSTKQIEWY
ncbi:transglutaminase-like domain-containing protein [Flavobacterium marginilacus]|uniref:transglutaminase-like domain-containing protein n=1 Tax=Flavobacterium marginilacus TaxID=3003256 RepID=UPI00248EA7F2|nr:transglutaminase-like domain-containing protein [Flavobacterium marginilacus]